MTPITVWMDGDQTPHLVAGRHRIEAMNLLNRDQIAAYVTTLDGIDRELWEIDENLVRSELSAFERAQQLKRRKEIWTSRKRESGQTSPTLTGRGNKGFAQDTADKVGMSKRSVNQAIRRSENIAIDDFHENLLRGIGASGAELDALAAMKPEKQQAAVAMVHSKAAFSLREAGAVLSIGQGKRQKSSEEIKVREELEAIRRAWSKASRDAQELFLKGEIQKWDLATLSGFNS